MASTSSQTPSSSTSSSTPTKWDVFLSFRGIDTRYSFTSHLYSALDRHNIRTFMDDPELRSGEVISDALLQAIQESRTYIVVFSENYASSRWCLDELVEILNCSNTMQRLVIPVFYNILPAVVRYQNGSFEKAFAKHEVRLAGEMERVENSRVATQCIDGLFRCFTTFFRSSGEIERVKNWRVTLTHVADKSGIHVDGKRPEADIVNEILHEILLQIKPTILHVAEYPVGLNSRVEDITALLSGSTKGVIKIGIYGMGGVGKTTLAKAVGVETKYKVNELDDAESEKLFFNHAFGNTKPNNTLMILSKDILRLAGGLPLALKVFGSYLYKESEDSWKSYIETLLRNPNSTIQERLMISLNALESVDPLLKKMFLDIACFFIGREREEVVEILYTYYSYAEVKIDILMKKCLLTINDANEFRMHDLLQDMGKEIARNNSPDEPGKYSRLWVPNDVCYVLEEHKGTEAIEGIMLDRFKLKHPLKEVSFAMETFRRMSKLRFLSFDNMINLTGKFERTLEDLRWFCWGGCPLKCLPFDFRPQKIVILELPYSNMTTMWEVNKVPNAFEMLKTLKMPFSRDLTATPDFRRLPCLRELNFEFCTSLKEVHNSIGSLVSLVSLNLNHCENLRSLPDTICNLRALEVICIQRCTMLEALPIQLGNIKSLKELNAARLAVLKLPDSIGDLSKLVKLEIGHNKELECVPDTICNLRALEVLSISYCTKVKELPEELGKIESLKVLNAAGLAFSKLPDSICNMRSLEILDISYCDKLERLPDQLWKLTRLLKLDARRATLLKKLPDIEPSQTSLSLTQLYLTRSEITALPSGISLLSNLDKLFLYDCHHLLSIAELPPNLTHIRAIDCTSLERINLSNLKHLKEFSFKFCKGLTEILGLGDLKSLKRMDLDGCPSSLPALTLTEPLFQIYSGFEQEIRVRLELEKFPDWIIQSSVDGSSESIVDLQPNLSHNYLGMILCFDRDSAHFSVMTSASNIFTDKKFYGSSIVILPRSIFSVTDADHTIKFTSYARRHWIRLLYKNEDDRNNPLASDLEVEEGGYR